MGKTGIRNICTVSLDTPAETQPKLHNRWHPDIPFAGTIKNGETVKIECVRSLSGSTPFNSPEVKFNFLTQHRSIGLVDKLVSTHPGPVDVLSSIIYLYLDLGNNDSADDVKNVDLTKIHYLSGPFEIETAEPGDVLLVEIMDVQPHEDHPWGFVRI